MGTFFAGFVARIYIWERSNLPTERVIFGEIDFRG